MGTQKSRVDLKRLLLPKEIRKAAKVKARSYVSIKTEGNAIIIEPAKTVAEKYGGTFQTTNCPEDLDEFNVKATKEDVVAFREYEEEKKRGKLKLIPLRDLTKGT